LIKAATGLRNFPRGKLLPIIENFDNEKNLAITIREMIGYLRGWATD
jgi:phosphopantothenate synthetase